MTQQTLAPAAPPQAQSNMRGWIVTLAALGINLASGTLYAWSIMNKALTSPKADHRWSALQGNLPFAVATFSFAIMMIFAGRLQDKLGPKRIALLGGIVLGGGFIVASFGYPTPILVALSFSIVGIGIGLAYAATTPAAVKWFPPARKGLITGLVVAGVGLAPAYAAPLADYMLNTRQISIAHTLVILGIGTIAAILVFGLIVSNPPAGYVPPAAATAATAKPRNVSRADRDFGAMLRTPQFYLLWTMFVLAAAPGLMVISNAAPIAREIKWNAGWVPVIVLSICNAIGRVLSGLVSDRIGRTNTMFLAFLLQAANIFAFCYCGNPNYGTPYLLAVGFGLTGLFYGAIYTLMPAATADFYGLKNLGVNYGFVFTAFGIAGPLGSLLAGSVKDVFGSFTVAYVILAVLLLIAAVLSLLTRAPRLADESAAPAK